MFLNDPPEPGSAGAEEEREQRGMDTGTGDAVDVSGTAQHARQCWTGCTSAWGLAVLGKTPTHARSGPSPQWSGAELCSLRSGTELTAPCAPQMSPIKGS